MKDFSPHRGLAAESPCIWMQAGVVSKKICRTDYDCPACRYDRALLRLASENQKADAKRTDNGGRRSAIVFWKDRLKALPQWQRPCIHHMKRRIGFRACTNAYHCESCEFDQYFYDEYTVHAIVKAVDVLSIEGFKIPQGYYLHKGHTWIRIEEGKEVRIGLDDFALRLLGPPDRIDAPLVGKEIRQNRPDFRMKRGPNSAAILSPVNGVVTAVNQGLGERGARVWADPYAQGWIARVHSDTLRSDLKGLMIGSETAEFLHAEVDRLHQVIEQSVGPLAADGGQFGDDIYGHMPAIGWERLTRTFLRT